MGRWNQINIGDRRGKLLVTGVDPDGTARHPRYFVRCDCGSEYGVRGGTLSSALGCKKCRPGGAKRKYGNRTVQNLKLYHSWISMRRRCDPTVEPERNKRWALRGITVCDEWKLFEVFEEWALANGYEPGLSLDRVDNDGNYEPGNCEWVTRSVNSQRARALYRFVQPGQIVQRAIFYDEPTFGDF